MSADNGIYILRTVRNKKETNPGCWEKSKPYYVYRVAHAQAIDNFDWYKNREFYNLGAYMEDIWGKSEVFLDKNKALTYAADLEKLYSYVEYGIVSINTDYTFYGDY